jgi:SAM-dependent methyltransferase
VVSSWHKREVAEAQLALVTTELQRSDICPPFVAFKWAMDMIDPRPGARLLDIGCGVGHYGVLLRRWYPGVVYYGTDISESMIEIARRMNTGCHFEVAGILDNSLDYDIVLLSGVLEYADNPPEALKLVVAASKAIKILHRARVLFNYGKKILMPTYCGDREEYYIWNLGEIESCVRGHENECLKWEEDQTTWVIQ